MYLKNEMPIPGRIAYLKAWALLGSGAEWGAASSLEESRPSVRRSLSELR